MMPKGLLKEYSRSFSFAIRSMDLFIIYGAASAAYVLKFNTYPLNNEYLFAVYIALLLAILLFNQFDLYRSIRGNELFTHSMHLLQAVAVLSLLLACIAFLSKSGEKFSREWFMLWMALAFFMLVSMRCLIFLLLRFMRAKGLNERRVVILGAGELGTHLAEAVQQALWTGFKIVNFLDDETKLSESIHGIPLKKTPMHLSQYLKQEGIDEIWLALPLRAEARVKEIMYQLRHQTITTRFVLDIFGLDLLNHSITDIAGFPVLNIRSTPMAGLNRVIKAIEDRTLALCILISISPLLLCIAGMIKLTSKGPIFFRQHRLGWDGRIIKVYKFRTMYEHQEEHGQLTQATCCDKRVTPFGWFLRRTSLDELPQFINVMQGRMSIVGPRPHALAHNEYYKEAIHKYMQRHRVKPGITGWAQVNGWRGETDTLIKMQKRVEYDLYYINNWSLVFDIKIILLTLFKGFYSRNAY